MSLPLPEPICLNNATNSQLEQAAAINHRELFYKNALADGGDVQIIDGLTWTYSGPDRGSMIPFPALKQNNAGELLDQMMTYFRAHPPASAGCWSLDPPPIADLGVKLLARGFQPGWWPGWMALDLEKINTGYTAPSGLQISADNESTTNDIENLPYAGENGAVSRALMLAHPELAQRFIATLNGKIVGHSCVFFTTGEYGAAGLYNVGVVPEARQRGIGKAVVTAACLYAKQHGYGYAVLNGTGRRMYEQVGFKWIGNGRTWWLTRKDYLTKPTTQIQVAFAEAVGIGSIAMLDNMMKELTGNELNIPLANGMTLVQLAVHYKQRVAAEWLIEHGATYSVLDAWDLGWKDRAAVLLKSDPEQVNRLYGDWQTTLLHTAAERNDIRLARLVLSHQPDLGIKDKNYHSTPLGWAEHLKRKEIGEMIKAVKP